MAKYRYDGEVEVILLGVTLNFGDEFEGPEGLTNYGLVPITDSKTKTKISDKSSTDQETTDPITDGSDSTETLGA